MKQYIKKKWFSRKFTILELLVVISIIAIMAALLLPSLSNVRNKGRASQCANSLRQIAVLSYNYTSDYNDYILGRLFLPDCNANWWAWVLIPGNMWYKLDCPETIKSPGFPLRGYAMNHYFMYTTMKIARVKQPSMKGYIVDSEPATTRWGLEIYPDKVPGSEHNALPSLLRHNKISNILYVDGHVAGELTWSIYQIPTTSNKFKQKWFPDY